MAFALSSQVILIVTNMNIVSAPFMVGLAVPAGVPLGSDLVEKFGSFTGGVLMNILISTAFMRADLYLFISNFFNLKQSMIVMFVAFLLKMLGCMIPPVMLKMPINEAAALGLILNYTGFVQLNQSSDHRDRGEFSDKVYGFMAFYILLNATFIPIVVKKLYNPSEIYDGKYNRNALMIKPHSELKILTCIYRQDNADSYIKLLDTINPSKESPIGIYVLHLVELIGRYVPVLVSHSKQKPISTNTSQKIVYDFNQYENNNWDSVSVQLFTSLSSFSLMDEDVINIALEKKTPLIILPLHRRWSIHGCIEADDKGWRIVNRNVLEKAPCSVAIYFSRGSLVRQRFKRGSSFVSYLSVCMIFFGGADDREALILARRMLKNPQVTLTIIHFLRKDHQEEMDESEDRIYDAVLIEDIKNMSTTNEHLDYRSHCVDDGAQTLSMVRALANQFDLFVVGRRYGVSSPQTSGLSEWIELPELGIIGDLFASKDLTTRASVLVVQEQMKIRQLGNL
ncbi:cation/H(+) antiporter 4-like [Euphorbia lathyris]|uniref:cation/H(+) antiporter 4-like n=1 Tax=Euphorbia lathyris TaxID=212925 RepID=UPI0033131D76